MTWVIGAVSAGFAAAISDTQITRQFPNGATEPVGDFGVQKIHAIDDRKVAGFAGNIQRRTLRSHP